MTQKNAIRCCSDTQKSAWKKNNNCDVWGGSDEGASWKCTMGTYDEALELCASQGARLCTKAELKCTKGSGCGYDNKMTWTSSLCGDEQAPTGPPPQPTGPPPQQAMSARGKDGHAPTCQATTSKMAV